jgi:hypothetical protein
VIPKLLVDPGFKLVKATARRLFRMVAAMIAPCSVNA